MEDIEDITGVLVTPLEIKDTPSGCVLHGLRDTDVGFLGFGECYFSTIDQLLVKGWKRHNKMTLNLIVPHGEILFVLVDDRESKNAPIVREITLSKSNYCRLTIPPLVWFGFQGLASNNFLMNVANIKHDPHEVDAKTINHFNYIWKKQ